MGLTEKTRYVHCFSTPVSGAEVAYRSLPDSDRVPRSLWSLGAEMGHQLGGVFETSSDVNHSRVLAPVALGCSNLRSQDPKATSSDRQSQQEVSLLHDVGNGEPDLLCSKKCLSEESLSN